MQSVNNSNPVSVAYNSAFLEIMKGTLVSKKTFWSLIIVPANTMKDMGIECIASCTTRDICNGIEILLHNYLQLNEVIVDQSLNWSSKQFHSLVNARGICVVVQRACHPSRSHFRAMKMIYNYRRDVIDNHIFRTLSSVKYATAAWLDEIRLNNNGLEIMGERAGV